MTAPGQGESAAALRVTRGGVLGAEETAALVVALTPATDEGQDEDHVGFRQSSAWREASLLEGVGFRPFVSVDDVERYHRSLA